MAQKLPSFNGADIDVDSVVNDFVSSCAFVHYHFLPIHTFPSLSFFFPYPSPPNLFDLAPSLPHRGEQET